VSFVEGKVTLGQFLSQQFAFCLPIITPPMFYNSLVIHIVKHTLLRLKQREIQFRQTPAAKPSKDSNIEQ
jgi:hypothetical protein